MQTRTSREAEIDYEHRAALFRDRQATGDLVWEGGGKQITVGGFDFARNSAQLAQLGVTHIVNCTHNLPLASAAAPGLRHLRFPVTFAVDRRGHPQALREFFRPLLEFVEEASHVVVHCRAGCHRAGATAVCLVSHFGRMGVYAAIARIRRHRRVVSVRGDLLDVCFAFHDSMAAPAAADATAAAPPPKAASDAMAAPAAAPPLEKARPRPKTPPRLPQQQEEPAPLPPRQVPPLLQQRPKPRPPPPPPPQPAAEAAGADTTAATASATPSAAGQATTTTAAAAARAESLPPLPPLLRPLPWPTPVAAPAAEEESDPSSEEEGAPEETEPAAMAAPAAETSKYMGSKVALCSWNPGGGCRHLLPTLVTSGYHVVVLQEQWGATLADWPIEGWCASLGGQQFIAARQPSHISVRDSDYPQVGCRFSLAEVTFTPARAGIDKLRILSVHLTSAVAKKTLAGPRTFQECLQRNLAAGDADLITGDINMARPAFSFSCI